MRMAIMGTGQVGSALAQRLQQLGHDVKAGSRTPDGEPAQKLAGQGVEVTSYPAAAAHGEIIVNALPGEVVIGILSKCQPMGRSC